MMYLCMYVCMYVSCNVLSSDSARDLLIRPNKIIGVFSGYMLFKIRVGRSDYYFIFCNNFVCLKYFLY